MCSGLEYSCGKCMVTFRFALADNMVAFLLLSFFPAELFDSCSVGFDRFVVQALSCPLADCLSNLNGSLCFRLLSTSTL